MRLGDWGISRGWGELCGKEDEVMGDKGLETKKGIRRLGIAWKEEREITVENKTKRDNETRVKGIRSINGSRRLGMRKGPKLA